MSVVALVGASGFVGSAVRAAMETNGHQVVPVPAPRLRTSEREISGLLQQAFALEDRVGLATKLAGASVLVNAAGNPDASSLDVDGLFGANALLPRVLAEAAGIAGVPRMVHISSAVVQNDRTVLDDTEDIAGFSPYSFSKVAGELALSCETPAGITITRYRPPSVHARGRRVTERVAAIARSPLASVAGPGSQSSPQALLDNVASAVAYLASTPTPPPSVVIHPWEGLTASSLMVALGRGRQPRVIPRSLAASFVRFVKTLGRVSAPVAANARRLDVLWFGQGQAESWLTRQGWTPPVGMEGWAALAEDGTDER